MFQITMSYDLGKGDLSKWLTGNVGLTTAVAATAGAALLYYLSKRGPSEKFPVSADDQSAELEVKG